MVACLGVVGLDLQFGSVDDDVDSCFDVGAGGDSEVVDVGSVLYP